MLVDSHVNLHGERYADDLEEVLARADEVGVRAMLAISDRLENTEEIAAIVADRRNMWRSVGVHPHYADDFADLAAERLIELSRDEKVIGIGECGLDYHYEYSDRGAQQAVFRAHIVAARETGLPLIIHTREADADMIGLLAEAYGQGPLKPLLHCYTSGQELLERTLEAGGYVAFSGILTFKNAAEVRRMAEIAPLDRIIIETDCPFLAPVPKRGRRNEPAFLPHVAERLAELKGVSTEEVARATTDNFFQLFDRASRP